MPRPGTGAPGILALADRARLRNLFTAAGFGDPEFDEVAFTWDFAVTDAYWEYLRGAAGAIAMVVGRLDDEEQEHVREQVAELIEPFAGEDGIETPAVSVVAAASEGQRAAGDRRAPSRSS